MKAARRRASFQGWVSGSDCMGPTQEADEPRGPKTSPWEQPSEALLPPCQPPLPLRQSK